MRKYILGVLIVLILLVSSCSANTKEVFYGDWVIKEYIKTNTPAQYGEETIKKRIGKKLAYFEDYVKFDNTILKSPHYYKQTLSEKDLVTNFVLSFAALGIKTESVVEIDVYKDKDFKDSWDRPGNLFLIKDKNTLILYDEGSFYELVRKK